MQPNLPNSPPTKLTTASADTSGDDVRLGFLRVVEVEHAGYVGGILVTNRHGRPLEFQCTTPVQPNRTQTILYGRTLRPFVFSELIGKTLYERLSVKPHLVLVDDVDLLPLREQINLPVGCLVDASEVAGDAIDTSLVRLGRQPLRVHANYPGDATAWTAQTERIPEDADWKEPLDRIRDALQETLRSGAVA